MGNVLSLDSLKNFIANLNTGRDKQTGALYSLTCIPDEQLSAIYRTSWMGRKVVDIPAQDATRKWREWQADAEQIKAIEAEEARLNLPQKVKKGLQEGRLYGGAGIYISIRGDDPALPLNPGTVQRGGIDFLTVMPRRVLSAGEIQTDPIMPGYGKPKYYEVSRESGGMVRIHASRLVLFDGNPILDPESQQGTFQGWGDSVLQSAYESVRNADATMTNVASLVYEAKVDVLQIPGLAEIMANPRDRQLLEDRVVLSAQLKGNNGMLVLDAEEEHSTKSFNFAGLPDITRDALQAVAGSADIPVTRFLGQTPSGLSSTGESDLRNYYDSVASMQTLILTPALSILDECLIRSALGSRPEDVAYEWASLWQTSDKERSKISKETAETIKILSDTRLFPDDALSEAAAAMLVEHSIMPTLEIEASEGIEGERPEDAVASGSSKAVDAEPRTLFVQRKVLNTDDIIAWARGQGIQKMVPDLHVTIAFSRTPIDWTKAGRDWSEDDRGRINIKPGGPRTFEPLGDEAKVLMFASDDLEWRHKRILECGASWDYPDYQPHITITKGNIPDDVEPYQGPIVLGPEIFEELNEDAFSEIVEVEL